MSEVSFTRARGLAGQDTVLIWVEVVHVDASNSPTTYRWSTIPMADATYKEPRVLSFGHYERNLSDRSGAPIASTFSVTIADTDRLCRSWLSNDYQQYLVNREIVVKLTTQYAIDNALDPMVIARGVIRGYEPLSGFQFRFEATDLYHLQTETLLPRRLVDLRWFPATAHQSAGVKSYAYLNFAAGNFEDAAQFVVGSRTYTMQAALTTTANCILIGATVADTMANIIAAVERQAGNGTLYSDATPVNEQVSSHVQSGTLLTLQALTAGTHANAYAFTTTSAVVTCVKEGLVGTATLDYGEEPVAVTDPRPNTLGLPEPVVYGTFTGGAWPCQAVGTVDVSGNPNWVRVMVAAHAVKSIDEVYIDGVAVDHGRFGVDILVPGYTGWPGGATRYVDITATIEAGDPTEATRRYTFIYIIGPDATSIYAGDKTMSVDLKGVEDVGDGSGTLIATVQRQHAHFARNYMFPAIVTHPDGYVSGAWLASDTWADGTDRVDNTAFEAAHTYGGYAGHWGLTSQISLGQAIALLNVSGDTDSGFNKKGQYTASMQNPLASTSVAWDDTNDILTDGFVIVPAVSDMANIIPYSYEPRYWGSGDAGKMLALVDFFHIEKVRQRLEAPTLELALLRDAVTAGVVTRRRMRRNRVPTRAATMQLGLAALSVDLGDYVSVTHAEGAGASGWVSRVVQVKKISLDADQMKVTVAAEDVTTPSSETLVDVDLGESESEFAGGGTSQEGVSGGGGSTVVTVIRTTGVALTGSGLDWQQSSVPTWVAASQIRVVVNTVTRGSLTGVVRIQLAAAAGSVTARLWNRTMSTLAGTSVVCSDTSFGDPSVFPVTFYPGECVYQLEYLPSLANTDVAAIATME